MGKESDANGNYHGENGQFVSLRAYVERIFDERDRQTEFARIQLQQALEEAKETTERAMVEAKNAADDVNRTLVKRLDVLESGGAPFASRLDQSLVALKADVGVLKDNMVRTDVLDALQDRAVADAKAQRRQFTYIAATAVASFVFSLILLGIQVLGR